MIWIVRSKGAKPPKWGAWPHCLSLTPALIRPVSEKGPTSELPGGVFAPSPVTHCSRGSVMPMPIIHFFQLKIMLSGKEYFA